LGGKVSRTKKIEENSGMKLIAWAAFARATGAAGPRDVRLWDEDSRNCTPQRVSRRSRGIVLPFLLFLACSSVREADPTGVVARFGSVPTLDGVFDSGEWDDATIVRADALELFRVKHDGVNLYFALRAGGGDILFNTDGGVRVLHWSAQLGSAEYVKSDALTQSLAKSFAFELRGLQNETPAVIQETLAEYLAKNGWAATTASMGRLMQSELVVSFDWLGVNTGSGRFVEIPNVRIGAGLVISRGDPRERELQRLSREEMKRLYPPLSWPAKSPPRDSIGMGNLPETIRVDAEDYGKIWIDLRK
jgi:hypothetical protein